MPRTKNLWSAGSLFLASSFIETILLLILYFVDLYHELSYGLDPALNNLIGVLMSAFYLYCAVSCIVRQNKYMYWTGMLTHAIICGISLWRYLYHSVERTGVYAVYSVFAFQILYLILLPFVKSTLAWQLYHELGANSLVHRIYRQRCLFYAMWKLDFQANLVLILVAGYYMKGIWVIAAVILASSMLSYVTAHAMIYKDSSGAKHSLFLLWLLFCVAEPAYMMFLVYSTDHTHYYKHLSTIITLQMAILCGIAFLFRLAMMAAFGNCYRNFGMGILSYYHDKDGNSINTEVLQHNTLRTAKTHADRLFVIRNHKMLERSKTKTRTRTKSLTESLIQPSSPSFSSTSCHYTPSSSYHPVSLSCLGLGSINGSINGEGDTRHRALSLSEEALLRSNGCILAGTVNGHPYYSHPHANVPGHGHGCGGNIPTSTTTTLPDIHRDLLLLDAHTYLTSAKPRVAGEAEFLSVSPHMGTGIRTSQNTAGMSSLLLSSSVVQQQQGPLATLVAHGSSTTLPGVHGTNTTLLNVNGVATHSALPSTHTVSVLPSGHALARGTYATASHTHLQSSPVWDGRTRVHSDASSVPLQQDSRGRLHSDAAQPSSSPSGSFSLTHFVPSVLPLDNGYAATLAPSSGGFHGVSSFHASVPFMQGETGQYGGVMGTQSGMGSTGIGSMGISGSLGHLEPAMETFFSSSLGESTGISENMSTGMRASSPSSALARALGSKARASSTTFTSVPAATTLPASSSSPFHDHQHGTFTHTAQERNLATQEHAHVAEERVAKNANQRGAQEDAGPRDTTLHSTSTHPPTSAPLSLHSSNRYGSAPNTTAASTSTSVSASASPPTLALSSVMASAAHNALHEHGLFSPIDHTSNHHTGQETCAGDYSHGTSHGMFSGGGRGDVGVGVSGTGVGAGVGNGVGVVFARRVSNCGQDICTVDTYTPSHQHAHRHVPGTRLTDNSMVDTRQVRDSLDSRTHMRDTNRGKKNIYSGMGAHGEDSGSGSDGEGSENVSQSHFSRMSRRSRSRSIPTSQRRRTPSVTHMVHLPVDEIVVMGTKSTSTGTGTSMGMGTGAGKGTGMSVGVDSVKSSERIGEGDGNGKGKHSSNSGVGLPDRDTKVHESMLLAASSTPGTGTGIDSTQRQRDGKKIGKNKKVGKQRLKSDVSGVSLAVQQGDGGTVGAKYRDFTLLSPLSEETSPL